MNYRNPDLLKLAKYAPHCMCCGCQNHGQIVMAHANWSEFGKAMGMKAHDCFVAALCDVCHRELDQGLYMAKLERFDKFLMSFFATLLWLYQSGLIVVKRVK